MLIQLERALDVGTKWPMTLCLRRICVSQEEKKRKEKGSKEKGKKEKKGKGKKPNEKKGKRKKSKKRKDNERKERERNSNTATERMESSAERLRLESESIIAEEEKSKKKLNILV